MNEPLFTITKNLLNKKRIGEWIRIRGLIEGIIYTIALCKLIDLFPFVRKVQIILSVCLSVLIIAICLLEYKSQTPSEIIVNLYKERPYKHHYRLRSIADEEGYDQSSQGMESNKSYAEVFAEKIKELYRNRQKESK